MSEMEDKQDDPEFAAVLAEYLRRIDQGENVDQDQFIAEHAQFAKSLREYFETANEVARLAAEPEMTLDSDIQTAPSESSLDVVRYIGDYELLEVIARGGMGVVYRARQVSLNRIVAVKMILAGSLADEADVSRFHAEAEAAAILDHPGIVPIYEIGEHKGQHYFSMAFVDGESLAEHIKDGPLPPRDAAAYALKIAEAVAFAHEHGVIHRDLKPSNVLLDSHGEPKVTDFGLAKRLEDDSGLTATGQILGTPSFMSPEQAAGRIPEVSESADVYSLGAILYALLTGRPPFQAATVAETLRQVLERDAVPPRRLNNAIDRDLEVICLKCLEKERGRRYASANEMADDLRRHLNGEPILARPISKVARGVRWCRRKPVTAGLLATVGLLVALVAIASPLIAIHQSKLRGEAETRRIESETRLIDMYTSSGLAASDLGNSAEALLWFANASRLASNDPDRQLANRTRVRTWRHAAPTPICAFRSAGDAVLGIEFHPDGQHILTHAVKIEEIVDQVGKSRTLPTMLCNIRSLANDHQTEGLCGVRAAWSHDGSRLALAQDNGVVTIRQFPDGEILDQFHYEGRMLDMEFSADASLLAVSGASNCVWDCRKHEFAMRELAHPWNAPSITFNRDGSLLATSCWDRNARVFPVGISEDPCTPIYPPIRHDHGQFLYRAGNILPPVFIDNGKGLLTCPSGAWLEWRDAESGDLIREILLDSKGKSPTLDGENKIRSLVVSPEGRFFAAGGNRRARVWRVEDGQPAGPLIKLNHYAYSMAFSQDGETLFIASGDRRLQAWSVTSGQRVGSPIVHQRNAVVVSLSADGRLIGTAEQGGLVRVFTSPSSFPQGNLELDHRECLPRLSADGKYFLPIGGSHLNSTLCQTRMYEVDSLNPAGPILNMGGILIDADFSPIGEQVATISSLQSAPSNRVEDQFLPGGAAGHLRFWDWRTGEVEMAPIAMPSEPRDVTYSPDGGHLAVICAAGQLVFVDAESGTFERQIQIDTPQWPCVEYVNNGRVKFGNDGQTVITYGLNDPCVRVWDLDSGALKYSLKHEAKCHAVELSTDGKMLVTASYDNSARLWDFNTGTPLGDPIKHPGWVFSARFSRDLRYVLTAGRDGVARLWDWRTGKLACPPFVHDNEILDAKFIADGRFIITISHDQTARIWDSLNGKPLSPPLKLDGMGWSVAVTPDGRKAIVGGTMRGLRVFDLADLLPKEEVSLNELCLLGEVLSGHEIHTGGGVVNLEQDEWLQRWRLLRRGALAPDTTSVTSKTARMPTARLSDSPQRITDRTPRSRMKGLPRKAGPYVGIDLREKTNHKLDAGMHGSPSANSLSELPRGPQTMAGVKFQIGDGLIQLGGDYLPDKPPTVTGITVDQRFSRLCVLHGSVYVRQRVPFDIEDGTTIGSYVVRYEDGSFQKIPIVYGQHVREWWNLDRSKPVSNAQLAWIGTNLLSRQRDISIRLFVMEWENPKPEVTVSSIECASVESSPELPFCVAMSFVPFYPQDSLSAEVDKIGEDK